MKAFEVLGHDKSVTIQIVEGDISRQYTHVLINVNDAHLLNKNEFSASIMKIGARERAECARSIVKITVL